MTHDMHRNLIKNVTGLAIALLVLPALAPIATADDHLVVGAPDLRSMLFRDGACEGDAGVVAATLVHELDPAGCERPVACTYDYLQPFTGPFYPGPGCEMTFCGRSLEWYDNVYGTPPEPRPWGPAPQPWPVALAALDLYEEVAGVDHESEAAESDGGEYSTRTIWQLLGPGNDLYFGDGSSEWVDGGEGDDCIYLRGGNDNALGGPGNDEIHGQDGHDWISGEAGHDRLYGGSGEDFLSGEAGYDRVYGGSGWDEIHGGDDFDRLWGGSGDDFVYGGGATDWLYGEHGYDFLYGEDGNDRLYGGHDEDVLDGGAGNDIADGGHDDDGCYDTETDISC